MDQAESAGNAYDQRLAAQIGDSQIRVLVLGLAVERHRVAIQPNLRFSLQ